MSDESNGITVGMMGGGADPMGQGGGDQARDLEVSNIRKKLYFSYSVLDHDEKTQQEVSAISVFQLSVCNT